MLVAQHGGLLAFTVRGECIGPARHFVPDDEFFEGDAEPGSVVESGCSKLGARSYRVFNSNFGGGRQLFLAISSRSFTRFFDLRRSSSQSSSGITL
jgi:hypothetical protein